MRLPVQVTIAIATLVLALVGLAPTRADAQKPVVYPAEGQSAQQQQKDQTECEAWAKQSTGVDPVAVAQAPPPPQAPLSMASSE
jgi:hypothetical protein